MEGYGIQVIDGKQIRASRIALTIKLGRSLNALALHTCDNPGCVKPDHLYEGTDRHNAMDCTERKRGHFIKKGQKGELNYQARLSNDDVILIWQRLLAGDKPIPISRDFGISATHVRDIAYGRRHKWLQEL